MSLTFETFKTVLEHVELVQLFLNFTDLDPSAEDNLLGKLPWSYGCCQSVTCRQTFDPSANENYAIRIASEYGHADVVNVLLADSRVNPSARDNYAIGMASLFGRTEVVNSRILV